MNKYFEKYKALSPTEKGMIITAIFLALMVLLRFGDISHKVQKGFSFFSRTGEKTQTH